MYACLYIYIIYIYIIYICVYIYMYIYIYIYIIYIYIYIYIYTQLCKFYPIISKAKQKHAKSNKSFFPQAWPSAFSEMT